MGFPDLWPGMSTIAPMNDAELRLWVRKAIESMDGFSVIGFKPRADRHFRVDFSGDGKVFYVNVVAATFKKGNVEAVEFESNSNDDMVVSVGIGENLAGLRAVYDGTTVTFSHAASSGNHTCRCEAMEVREKTSKIRVTAGPKTIMRIATLTRL